MARHKKSVLRIFKETDPLWNLWPIQVNYGFGGCSGFAGDLAGHRNFTQGTKSVDRFLSLICELDNSLNRLVSFSKGQTVRPNIFALSNDVVEAK